MDESRTDAELASAEAAHKAKTAAQAVEHAREVQLAQVVEETAQRTKEALLEGLKEVFGEGDGQDTDQMKVLVRRIPILCTNIEVMHTDIAAIKSNLNWVVRLVLGSVIAAILKIVLFP